MNQNYSGDQLIKYASKVEVNKSGLSKSEMIDQIDLAFTQIVDSKFEFKLVDKKRCVLFDGDRSSPDGLIQTLIIRKLNDCIKRIYKEEQSNRRLIISQIITLLNENCPKWIIRADIHSFYESIDRSKLIEKFKFDSMLSYHSLSLLDALFSVNGVTDKNGLARGLSVSATMSEIYMRSFDKWVQQCSGVYYYARFVDDIIVFCSSNNDAERIFERMQDEALSKIGLKFNQTKTVLLSGSNIVLNSPLEYLGYKFFYMQGDGLTDKKAELKISIANKKVDKIKSRIILSLSRYCKDGEFSLLEKRIKFLTGNFRVKKREEATDLKAGVYFNYSSINDYSILDDLNQFYYKALYARSSAFGAELIAKLSNVQRKQLMKYSFRFGFEHKVVHRFSGADLKVIKSCWL